MELYTTLSMSFQLINILIFTALLIFPTIGVLMILRKLRAWEAQRASSMRIEQLEENDNLIVEDINTALTNIVERLTAIEERFEKEDRTIKGFKQ